MGSQLHITSYFNSICNTTKICISDILDATALLFNLFTVKRFKIILSILQQQQIPQTISIWIVYKKTTS